MKTKDFFENSPYPGEMLPYERYKLYNWVLELKPKNIIEIGCGLGGGSSYYMVEAIKENNKGMIYSCDPGRMMSNELLSKNVGRLKYYKINSTDLIKYMISENIIPDFLFFDGPEQPEVALNDIKELEKHITDGTYFSMHDWDTCVRKYDNGVSIKSLLIREYIEKSENWELVECLSSEIKNSEYDDMEFDSVGLCLYKYNK